MQSDALAARHGLGGFLIQPLDAVPRIRVYDGAAAIWEIHDGEILLNAIEGLHLEAPPVRPHGGAYAFLGEAIRDLVGLDRVMECDDLEAEFIRDIHHGGHLIGAIAMHMHADVALHDLGERLELQIALRRTGQCRCFVGAPPVAVLGFFSGGVRGFEFLLLVVGQLSIVLVPAVLVVLGIGKRLAITGNIAHACRRRLALGSVHSFRILTARHFQTIGSARKFHGLVGDGLNILDDGGAAADQIRRSGQDLQRGHAAFEGRLESWILRPDGMFGPDIGRNRVGRLVAIVRAIDGGNCVDAQVGMDVDDPGRHPHAVRIERARILRNGQVLAYGLDTPIGDQQVSAIEPLAGAREHGRALYQQGRAFGYSIRGGKGFGCQESGHAERNQTQQRHPGPYIHVYRH